jgi:prolyl oligopeptidase
MPSTHHHPDDDPFRALESDSEATRAWEVGQNTAADAALRCWDGFDELRAAVASHLARVSVTAPVRRGSHWFRVDSTPLVVADTPTGPARTLVDPGAASLDWFFPSPHGNRVAYGLSFGGDEQSVLHVIDTESGEVLPDRIPFTSNATVAWFPDESGFAVNAGTAPDFERVDKALFVHRLGQAEASLAEPIEVREPYCVYPQVSPGGRWLVAITSEVEPRADWIRALPDGEWRPFLLEVEGTCNGVFEGDDYVAVCTEQAPRGRLVRIPVRTAADRQTWSELIPQSDLVLRFVQSAGDLLVVGALRKACSVVIVLWPDGRSQELELPAAGLVSRSAAHGVSQPATANEGTGVAGDRDGFSFVLGAPDRSAGLYRYERETGGWVELRAAEAQFPFVVTRFEATAPDGVAVGYEVVHRADLEPTGLPSVLYAYGGWNAALVQGSLAANAHLVEAGAAFVLCHIRGGGEEGTDFHRDGALERKQHSYDDLYAIAEDVAVRGVADPGRIAVLGGSNGGLMVAVAVTQRPDLWCAACSLVPVTDMMRYHLSPYGETGLREYGNPDDPADAAVLRAYSPYHNIRAGVLYPPTLVIAGANDMRCPAWHARKFVARLQEVADGGPFVLRVMGGGHLSTRRGADLVAEWQGFLLKAVRAGLDG